MEKTVKILQNRNVKGILFFVIIIFIFALSFKMSNTQTIMNNEYKNIYNQVKAVKQNTQNLSFFMVQILNTQGLGNFISYLNTAKSLENALLQKSEILEQKAAHLKSLSTEKRKSLTLQLNIVSSALSCLTQAINGFSKIDLSNNALLAANIEPMVENLKLATNLFAQSSSIA